MYKLHDEFILAIKSLFTKGLSARYYFDRFVICQNKNDFIIGMASLSPLVKQHLANCFGVSYDTVYAWNCYEMEFISTALAIRVSKFMIRVIDEAN